MSDQSDVTELDQPLQAKPAKRKKGLLRENLEALFSAILLAFLIRSFVVEPYKIPSSSMVPTLLIGDHIFVNKFIYGLRIPGTKKWIYEGREPTRGEVIVFIYPEDESLDFIKRVVGLPGDHIRYVEGRLFINQQEVTSEPVGVVGVDPGDHRKLMLLPDEEKRPLLQKMGPLPFFAGYESYEMRIEKQDRINHFIQRSQILPNNDEINLVVPPDSFFVMGDNRDKSSDSRVWGFVPRKNLKGKAMFIWLSLDNDLGGVRYKRFGRPIY